MTERRRLKQCGRTVDETRLRDGTWSRGSELLEQAALRPTNPAPHLLAALSTRWAAAPLRPTLTTEVRTVRIAMVSLPDERPTTFNEDWLEPAEGQTLSLATVLAERNHEVDLYVSEEPADRLPTAKLPDGVGLIRLPIDARGTPTQQHDPAHVSTLSPQLREYWSNHVPDVVHAQEEWSGVASLPGCCDQHIPMVQSFRGPHFRRHGHQDERRNRLGRALLREAAAVQATYSRQADELTQLGLARDRVRVIPHGIDTKRFRPQGTVADHGERTRVVAIADPSHGPTIEALLSAIARRPDTELVVCATPAPQEERTELDRALSQRADRLDATHRLVLLGPVAADRLAPILRSADIVVCGADDEGSELATLAAMACARPVIATASGGALDTVVDGTTGFLVRPGDRGDLDRALARLLDDQLLREGSGIAGLERAEHRYTPERIGHEMEALYQRVTADRAPALACPKGGFTDAERTVKTDNTGNTDNSDGSDGRAGVDLAGAGGKAT